MKEYDVIVIGGGDVGLAVTFKALSSRLKVALIEKGKLGGTCVNVGCVPSKMLIYPATLAVQINEAKKFGIHTKISTIDFRSIMDRMRRAVKNGRSSIEEAVRDSKNLDFYHQEFRFLRQIYTPVRRHTDKGPEDLYRHGLAPVSPSHRGSQRHRLSHE